MTSRKPEPCPDHRVSRLNEEPTRPERAYVLYWMVANRRLHWNFSLDHAVALANRYRKPLVIFEPLRHAYPYASPRLHTFIVAGMRDNTETAAATSAHYRAFVERSPDQGSGLLEVMAANAVCVVTDDWPEFFLPKMQCEAAQRLDVAMFRIDSNGLLPMRTTDKVFSRAYDFRRHLQKHLTEYLGELPTEEPLAHLERPLETATTRLLERSFEQRPALASAELDDAESLIRGLDLPGSAVPTQTRGGHLAARRALHTFLEHRIERYADDRNNLDERATSELSPYLHFGHIGTHQVFAELTRRQGWTPDRLSEQTSGARHGWWGMSEAAESFLDQIVTWRELGFNMSSLCSEHKRLAALPEWALRTIDQHRGDPRPELYSREQLERAETDDVVWNAAQRELLEDGRIHNYLRMLWGKKIYEWSASAEEALATMIDLNDRYALDGRDPNSYSGIFWCLGRYDRAWGPERPIYGKLRYMTSRSARRKLDLRSYLERYTDLSELPESARPDGAAGP